MINRETKRQGLKADIVRLESILMGYRRAKTAIIHRYSGKYIPAALMKDISERVGKIDASIKKVKKDLILLKLAKNGNDG